MFVARAPLSGLRRPSIGLQAEGTRFDRPCGVGPHWCAGQHDPRLAKPPDAPLRISAYREADTSCTREAPRPEELPPYTYAYLLGVYLGDGCITPNGSSWSLRVVLDGAYPGIIDECCSAIERISGSRPTPRRDPRGQRCVHVESTWYPWRGLFPQHGPGRKHTRRIALTEWQYAIVNVAPEPLLRGLIHTDGWRGVNRVRAKGRDYAYPRYQFSNRSDDIRQIFPDACDLLGIEWRQWTRYHVSIARAASVRLMDSFVGPKT
jgi:hypothetical protein